MRAALLAALFLIAAMLLLWGTALQQDLAFRALLLVVLTTSWNLMANAGLISLGHSAFWGVGGYVAVVLMNRTGMPALAGFAAAQLVGAALGAAMARITGRLRGMFFGIATLALAEGLRVAALMLSDLTGGAGGVYLVASLAPSPAELKLLALAYAAAAVGAAWLLSRSRFQFACRAMRNSQDAAQMIGIDPVAFRTILVAISGLMAAGAGALGTLSNGYLDPGAAFTLQNTIMPQIAAILGGVYTLAGPVVGGIAVTAIVHATTLVKTDLAGLGLFCLGVVLIAAVSFMPGGLMGLFDRLARPRPSIPLPQPRRAAP